MEWKVGDVKITKVVEHELPIPLNGLLNGPPEDAAERYPWLAPDFVDGEGNARLSIHGLVVDTGDRRILVDTCVGENRADLPLPPPATNFVKALAAAGYEIDDID